MAYQDMTPDIPGLRWYFRQLLSGPHENFHYVIGDPGTRTAAIVDPAFHLDRIFQETAQAGYQIERALVTHGHWDHIGGLAEAVALGVKDVVLHAAAQVHADVRRARAAGAGIRFVADGETVRQGSIEIKAIHAPGHQPESTCYLAGDGPWLLFGGDCLFVGSCGRTDFPGGDTEAMYETMHRLRALPDAAETWVMPGHHYAPEATRPLAAEIHDNPALATRDRVAFEALPFLRG